MDAKIKLEVFKPAEERRCIQINGKANAKLMELYRATGLPLGQIVSQMIIQGAELVEIIESDRGDE